MRLRQIITEGKTYSIYYDEEGQYHRLDGPANELKGDWFIHGLYWGETFQRTYTNNLDVLRNWAEGSEYPDDDADYVECYLTALRNYALGLKSWVDNGYINKQIATDRLKRYHYEIMDGYKYRLEGGEDVNKEAEAFDALYKKLAATL